MEGRSCVKDELGPDRPSTQEQSTPHMYRRTANHPKFTAHTHTQQSMRFADQPQELRGATHDFRSESSDEALGASLGVLLRLPAPPGSLPPCSSYPGGTIIVACRSATLGVPPSWPPSILIVPWGYQQRTLGVLLKSERCGTGQQGMRHHHCM